MATLGAQRENGKDLIGDDEDHPIRIDPLYKPSFDHNIEKNLGASKKLRVENQTSKSRLSDKIKINLAQITAPKLSCLGDGVLEFEVDEPDNNPAQARLFNIMKKQSRVKNNQKLSTLQNWKAITEQKMKEKRTKEMSERQKLYNLEQEQISGVENNLQDEVDTELEEEEELSDEETSGSDDNSDEGIADEGQSDRKNIPVGENRECAADKSEIGIDQMSQETQNSFHLYVDTENQDEDTAVDFGRLSKDVPDTVIDNGTDRIVGNNDSLKLDCPKECRTDYKDLEMEENITSQQAFDEAILLLTNPFCKADPIDSTPELNMASSQQCTDNVSQSMQATFHHDENANDGSLAKPQTTNGLIMDKQLTSQEAENEILGLLTNPFSKAPLVEDSQTRMSSTQISGADLKESFKRKIEDFSDIEDENEEKSRENLPKSVKRNRCAKVVLSDDEDDVSQCSDVEDGKIVSEDGNETVCDADAGDESEDDAVDIDSDDEELKMAREIAGSKFWDGNKKTIRREFVENEAELSGSDVGSDDDDIGSENDELEAEEGDLDDLPSDDALKAQIEKIHNKQMLDDDHRKLLMYKDAYLPDGDLHTDTDILRRFRWRKPEEDVNMGGDISKVDVDDEIQILEDEALESWRQIQKEKAEFLCEKGLNSQELEEKSMDTDAATFNLFSFKKVSVRRSISTTQATSFASLLEAEAQNSPLPASQSSTKSRRESFLNRQQSTLHKIVNENSNSNLVSAVNAASSKSLFFAEQSLSFSSDVNSDNNNSSKATSRTTRIRLKNENQIKKPTTTKDFIKKENVDSVFELLK